MSRHERTAHGLRLRIDPTLCVAFGDCIEIAPGAFRLDAEDVVEFVAPEAVDRSCLLDACKSCPVDALTVFEADGSQLLP